MNTIITSIAHLANITINITTANTCNISLISNTLSTSNTNHTMSTSTTNSPSSPATLRTRVTRAVPSSQLIPGLSQFVDNDSHGIFTLVDIWSSLDIEPIDSCGSCCPTLYSEGLSVVCRDPCMNHARVAQPISQSQTTPIKFGPSNIVTLRMHTWLQMTTRP
jgi:hypothetical protein